MPNTLITPTIISDEGLMQIFNKSRFLPLTWRAHERDFGRKIGNTLQVRKPVKMESFEGADITNKIQDVKESWTTFTLNTRRCVPWKFDATELTMNIEEYSARYIQPAAKKLADDIDSAIAAHYVDFWHRVGTPGTTPNANSILGDALVKLQQSNAPDDDLHCVMTPKGAVSMADALSGLFLANKVQGMVEKGQVSPLMNFDITSSNNVYRHARGTASGTPLVATAVECGSAGSATYVTTNVTDETSTLYTDGWTAGTANMLRAGDAFTIDNVYAVNPVNGRAYDHFQQFTVVTTCNSGSAGGSLTAGYMAVTVSPAIVITGPYKTVDSAPVANAAITVVGVAEGKTSFAANMAFHRNAIGLASVDLVVPDSAPWSARRRDDGVSIRVVKFYDGMTDNEMIRLDIDFGIKTLYPEYGCVICGE